jgi:hypothetical protein
MTDFSPTDGEWEVRHIWDAYGKYTGILPCHVRCVLEAVRKTKHWNSHMKSMRAYEEVREKFPLYLREEVRSVGIFVRILYNEIKALEVLQQ